MWLRRLVAIAVLLMVGAFAIGCDDDDNCVSCDRDQKPPQPPQGVYTVTGNDSVFVFWSGPYDANIAEFVVWRSNEEIENYHEIARVKAVDNPDLDLIYYDPGYIDDSVTNGITYWYAVSSVDRRGRVSDLSAESVFDTPRPDGRMTIYDRAVRPEAAGFDLSTQQVVAVSAPEVDVFIDRDSSGIFYVNAANVDVELQPMGFTSSFDDIGWAPQQGWSANGWAEIVPGHTYVVAVKDSHDQWNYAKLRALSVNDADGSVWFQWAYQTDPNNPELIPANTETPTAQVASENGRVSQN